MKWGKPKKMDKLCQVIKLEFLSTYILPKDTLCSYRSLYVKKTSIQYDCSDNSLSSYMEKKVAFAQ